MEDLNDDSDSDDEDDYEDDDDDDDDSGDGLSQMQKYFQKLKQKNMGGADVSSDSSYEESDESDCESDDDCEYYDDDETEETESSFEESKSAEGFDSDGSESDNSDIKGKDYSDNLKGEEQSIQVQLDGGNVNVQKNNKDAMEDQKDDGIKVQLGENVLDVKHIKYTKRIK